MGVVRGERLQIMLEPEELKAIDDWRFAKRMPSRAAAVRELLRRGLNADGFNKASDGAHSNAFGVLSDPEISSTAPSSNIRRTHGSSGRGSGTANG